ncbi:MAG: (2Fe-2S)-binding protein [Candidatus Promineifilaceae bacterium]
MKINVNGQSHDVNAAPESPLLWALRDNLNMVGTKFGCGGGFCGACTVHVDGTPTRSCITLLKDVEGKQIRTVESLATPQEDGSLQLHPVQQAFIDHQVPQCGWCMNGQMMTALGLLENNMAPSEEDIVSAMGENYCRCGCYVRIKSAVAHAANLMGEA